MISNQAAMAHFVHSVLQMPVMPIVTAGVSDDDTSLPTESDESTWLRDGRGVQW